MSKRFKDFYIGTPILAEAFYEKLPEEYRRLAFTVSHIQKIDIVAKVMRDVERGLEKFETFDKWQETLEGDVYKDFSASQLETVYRNTMSTAYNNGIIEQSKSTGFTTKFAFQAILDDVTRDSHRECDGTVLPVDHPFWLTHTPPLGHRCRCQIIPLNEENEVEDQLPENLQLARAEKGFGFQAKNLETHLNAKFRQNLNKLPSDLRIAAINSFAKKTEVVDDFLDENKKNFTKPEKGE